MSLSISPTGAADQQDAATGQRSPEPNERDYRHHFPLARQWAVITEMLETMDTLTVAGQRHTMSKVVGFVENQVAHAALPLGHRNQHMLAELLRQLKGESQRLSLDVSAFTQHARSLVGLLNVVA